MELALPIFSTLVRQELALNLAGRPWLLLCFAGLALLVGIVSGSYPAFYLSRFSPIQVLKGKFTIGPRKTRLRSLLVVFQFFTSTVFIIQAFIFGIQVDQLRNKDLGFNKRHVVVLPIVDDQIRQSIKSLKKELQDYSGIIGVGATSTLPGWHIPRSLKIPQGFTDAQMQLMDEINVDHDFIPALGIQMAAGRNFSEESTWDQQNAIIINETAMRRFGWDNPVGKTIKYSIGQDKFATGTVCGVVRDFHLASLFRVIEPLFISNHPENVNYLLVRLDPEKMSQAMDHIKAKWCELYPNHPYEYSFLEQSYDTYVRAIQKVLQALRYFVFLTVFIACLGIFALATYNSEYRIKEVGIRKVLGASTFEIILKLNKETAILVGIAVLLALSFMQIPFLDPHTFLPYFSGVKFSVYLQSAMIVMLIAFATISYQSLKTAMAKPVDSLRYE